MWPEVAPVFRPLFWRWKRLTDNLGANTGVGEYLQEN